MGGHRVHCANPVFPDGNSSPNSFYRQVNNTARLSDRWVKEPRGGDLRAPLKVIVFVFGVLLVVGICLRTFLVTRAGLVQALNIADTPFDCGVTLALSPRADPYSSLKDAVPGRMHFTCPFDATASVATVYFSRFSNACERQEIAGFKVIKSAAVSNATTQFRHCSDLINDLKHKTRTASNETTYVWVPRVPGDQLDMNQQQENIQIQYAITLSGLPIVDMAPSNVGVCFSERSGTAGPPSVWLAKVHIKQPDWAVERQVPGKSCSDVF